MILRINPISGFIFILHLLITNLNASVVDITPDPGAGLFPNIQKLNDERYVSTIPDKRLYLVMERVTDDNYRKWERYFEIQQDRNVAFKLAQSTGLSYDNLRLLSNGSQFALEALQDGLRINEEKWVAYITDNPDKSISGGYEGESPLDAANQNAHIKMFMTVTSSPNALVTTHLGISRSLEDAVSSSPIKGVSMDLHAFAAGVMLMRNPARRYMLNQPAVEMRNIMAKKLPKGSVFIGTKESLAAISVGPAEYPPLINTIKETTGARRLGMLIGIDIFKKKNPHEIDFSISIDDHNYLWLFRKVFTEVPLPYALVDLQALARLQPIVDREIRTALQIYPFDMGAINTILLRHDEFPERGLCMDLLVKAAESCHNREESLALIRKLLTENPQVFNQTYINVAFTKSIHNSVDPDIVQFLLSSENAALKPEVSRIKRELAFLEGAILEAEGNGDLVTFKINGMPNKLVEKSELVRIKGIIKNYLDMLSENTASASASASASAYAESSH